MYEVKDKVTSVGNKLSELKNKIANVYNGVKNKINEAYDAVSDWVAGKNKDAPPPKEVVEVAKQHKHPVSKEEREFDRKGRERLLGADGYFVFS